MKVCNTIKWCYACKQNKHIKEFGKNRSKKDGLSDECKECKKIADAKYHQKHREKRLEKMQEYRTNHLEHLNLKAREFARSEKGREINRKATKKYYWKNRNNISERTKKYNLMNSDKYKTRYRFGNAIKLGKIIRPTHCQMCNKRGLVCGHHSDYSKPFEVDWVCEKCHGKIHRKVR